MTDYRFEQLDLSADAVREEYERLFYASFLKVSSNRLVHTLWAWDHDARRLATRIGYEDQLVFGALNDAGALQSAIAFNVRMRSFQAIAFGFEPPRDPRGCFEVLTFFSRGSSLKLQLDLWTHCLAQMAWRRYHKAYATTARHPLKSYLRIGWSLEKQSVIGAEERFFLAYDLSALCGETVAPVRSWGVSAAATFSPAAEPVLERT